MLFHGKNLEKIVPMEQCLEDSAKTKTNNRSSSVIDFSVLGAKNSQSSLDIDSTRKDIECPMGSCKPGH